MPAHSEALDESRRDPEYLVIGKVVRPHGLRGEVRVRIMSGYPDRFKYLESVSLTRDPAGPEHPQIFEVERARLHQDFAILKLLDIEDREQADRLRKQFVVISLEDAVPLEEDEYYYYQLIGLEMVTVDGRSLGTVANILETGANEVYIVESPQHGEILIPAIESVVQEIDLASGRIIISPIPGLLPDNA